MTEREMKGSSWVFFLLRIPYMKSASYEYIIKLARRIAQLHTHRNIDSLLKFTSIKHNTYVVNPKVIILMISVSENLLPESEVLFFLQNKICPFLFIYLIKHRYQN